MTNPIIRYVEIMWFSQCPPGISGPEFPKSRCWHSAMGSGLSGYNGSPTWCPYSDVWCGQLDTLSPGSMCPETTYPLDSRLSPLTLYLSGLMVLLPMEAVSVPQAAEAGTLEGVSSGYSWRWWSSQTWAYPYWSNLKLFVIPSGGSLVVLNVPDAAAPPNGCGWVLPSAM